MRDEAVPEGAVVLPKAMAEVPVIVVYLRSLSHICEANVRLKCATKMYD